MKHIAFLLMLFTASAMAEPVGDTIKIAAIDIDTEYQAGGIKQAIDVVQTCYGTVSIEQGLDLPSLRCFEMEYAAMLLQQRFGKGERDPYFAGMMDRGILIFAYDPYIAPTMLQTMKRITLDTLPELKALFK